jgi:hypothetical protein
VDITAETIKKVAAEASILSSIRHKNIVNILGVSVLPPRYAAAVCVCRCACWWCHKSAVWTWAPRWVITKLFMNHYEGTRCIHLPALPPRTSLTVLPRVNPAFCYT